MSQNEFKQFLEFLDNKKENKEKNGTIAKINKKWNYKEWSQKERDKFLLRKRKTKISKSEKVSRRIEGQKIEIKSKNLKKMDIKRDDHITKNLQFLKEMQEKTKLKKDVFDKIMKNLS